MSGPLKGLRVIDLSRVLAGPACTQILGDLGADVIKIERPGAGDDTRKWGPPFVQDKNGHDTNESAYYLSANRNKRSLALDITTPQGQEILHRLLEKADVLIENFKVGGLARYGLDYPSIHKRHPEIIYASITGFGQTGPMAQEPGYDLLVQAMGGLMAVTGAPDGEPMKAGVALSDVMTGLYTAIGILAALRHRDESGQGQHVDVALLDCTVAGLVNLAQYYLTIGKPPPRCGNAHSTIVPYQAFETADRWIVIGVGNDGQFSRLATTLGHGEWAQDERFATNRARVANRETLVPLITALIREKPSAFWMAALEEAQIPCGPVNDLDAVFATEQLAARDMKITLPHAPSGQDITLVGSPLKLSATPVSYTRAPPAEGEHSAEILRDLLGLNEAEIRALKAAKALG